MKLKNSEFKKILVFKHYYNTLSDYDKVKIRDNIIKKCGFSLPTFYYKNKNDSYTKLEVTIIHSIINKYRKHA
jgi:hypothetical protein